MAASKKPSPPKRKRPAPLVWRTLSFLGAWVRRPDGRKLFVYVADDDGEWVALAVEGPDKGDAHAVLDDHGHRMIGQFANGPAAQRAAAGFARRWMRSRAKIDECGCLEIGRKAAGT